MFLSMLNEKEGKNFMELAQIAIDVDGKKAESEKAVFHTYRMELNLPDYTLQNTEYSKIVTALQGSTKKVKKAIIIELAGVLDADEVIDENENNWIMKLGAEWGFRDSEINKMVRWTRDFNDLLQEAYDYINKR